MALREMWKTGFEKYLRYSYFAKLVVSFGIYPITLMAIELMNF